MACILLIDDDQLLRETLRDVLEEAGHIVVEAADGLLGVAAYRRQGADLVITDIEMPSQGGLETIRQLRALNPTVPIIAMSGNAFEAKDAFPVAVSLGASATLNKPFALKTLLGTVSGLLDESGRRDSVPSQVTVR